MEKLKNIPSLRFPEFEGEWENTKLGKIATNKSGKYNPIKNNEFVKCVELEHLATETGMLLGYSDGSLSASIKNKFDKGDVLFGKLRPYLKKYLQAPFDGVCSSEIWVLKGTSISNEFLYNIVQTDKFIDLANQSSGSKMPRADWNVVENGIFSFPTLAEQTKIASFLTAVDDKLTALKQKKALLEQYKKGAMQKIFSQELRFKDDNGNEYPDWEEKKLGDLCNYKNGGSFENFVSNEGSYNLISLNSIDINGKLKKQHKKVTITDNSLQKGDLIMVLSDVAHGNFLGLTDIIPNDEFVLNQRMAALKPKTDFDSFYMKTFINYNQSYFKLMGQGSSQLNLSKGDVENFVINLPIFEEQTKIATFLSAIDDKINHSQSQIEKTEVWKKGLLQQMFV